MWTGRCQIPESRDLASVRSHDLQLESTLMWSVKAQGLSHNLRLMFTNRFYFNIRKEVWVALISCTLLCGVFLGLALQIRNKYISEEVYENNQKLGPLRLIAHASWYVFGMAFDQSKFCEFCNFNIICDIGYIVLCSRFITTGEICLPILINSLQDF